MNTRVSASICRFSLSTGKRWVLPWLDWFFLQMGKDEAYPYREDRFRKKIQDGVEISPDMRALTSGPSMWVGRWKAYTMNGCWFHVKSVDDEQTTQNSGVYLKSETVSYSRAQDASPRIGDVEYHGVVKDIIELDYHEGRKVVLFDCDWIDSLSTRKPGIKFDDYGHLFVNFNRLLPPPDTYILGSQAHQVFYVVDPNDPQWHGVLPHMPRDFFDMGDIIGADISAPQVLDEVNEADEVEARMDVEPMDVDPKEVEQMRSRASANMKRGRGFDEVELENDVAIEEDTPLFVPEAWMESDQPIMKNQRITTKKKVTKSLLNTLEGALTPSCKVLCAYVTRVMETNAKYIESRAHDDTFGAARNVILLKEEIKAFLKMEQIGQQSIVVYICYLYERLMEAKSAEKIGFLDPSLIYNATTRSTEIAKYIACRLSRLSADGILLIPYNSGVHWMLTVIDEDRTNIYHIDPLANQFSDEGWRTIVNSGMKLHGDQIGKRPHRKSPRWKSLLGAPKQADSVSCGYVVMRYMKEICEDLSLDLETKYPTKRKEDYYSKEQLDEVRDEWANFVLNNMIEQ